MYISLIKYIAPVALVFGALYAAYDKGVDTERDRWETKAYQATIKAHEAASKFTAGVLTDHKETQDDAQIKIDQLQNELAAAATAYDSLHDSAKAYAKRAADSSRAAANCKAAEKALGVLADLHAESDRLAGIYAKEADDNRLRLESCNGFYNSLKARIESFYTR
jgi:hypothetical protein